MSQPRTVFDRYNSVAAYCGWLPIGIGPHSDARTLRDAADRIEWRNLDVARALRDEATRLTEGSV
jgi:hypothetical protein